VEFFKAFSAIQYSMDWTGHLARTVDALGDRAARGIRWGTAIVNAAAIRVPAKVDNLR
jgi:hypothetical protein